MQERKYHGQKATTKRIDSIFARIEKWEEQCNQDGKQN
jgi:hypothetical protein